MKKIKLFVMLLLSFALVACGAKVEKNTDTTVKETVKEEKNVDEKKEKNIIAASKSVSEYLDAFEVKLVGIAEQKGLPERYKDVKRVGSPRKLNLEVMTSLKPDLVIANETSKKDIDSSLVNQNIDTLYIDGSTYDSIFENIKLIGEKIGKSDKSQDIIDKIKERESEVLKKAEKLKGKKFALLFGSGKNFQVMTENTYLGDLLKKIGLENISKDSTGKNGKFIPYSLENIVAGNPDYILTLAHGNKEQAEKIFKTEFDKDMWKNMTAVKEGRLIHLDDKKHPITGDIHVLETLESLIDLLLENK